jgi:integrase
MARKPGIPSYRRKGSQAVVTLYDLAGRRRDFRLGAYGTQESRAEYTRVISEWQESHRRLQFNGQAPVDLTVNELILEFWHYVEGHYRHPDGTPTSEVANFRCALRPVRELYGRFPAKDFGPLALKAVRGVMVKSGLVRGVINSRVSRIRLMFKWAASEELISSSVYEHLRTVSGLAAGRTEAPDRPPIQPVTDEQIEAALPHVGRNVAAMIRLQRLTGMRPGEVIRIRRSEIDMSGSEWMYQPTRHKMSYRGNSRVVPIGQKGQEILKEFFTPAIDDYLFSPIRERESRYAAMRAARKSAVQPSQVSRKKSKPKRLPGQFYTGAGYTRAIRGACFKAGIPKWHPNQLRHSYATEVRKLFGLEAAQVVLGHSSADTTQIYAKANADLAAIRYSMPDSDSYAS